MSTILLTRRAALIGLGAGAAFGLAGCNTTQTAAAVPSQAAGSSFRISTIQVDTAPLLAQSGDPTADWAQQALPGQFAQALAPHMAPGDPNGATLSVRINSISLGQGGPADPDTMKGVATLSGGAGGAPRQNSLAGDVDLYLFAGRSDAGGAGAAWSRDGALAGLRLPAREKNATLKGPAASAAAFGSKPLGAFSNFILTAVVSPR